MLEIRGLFELAVVGLRLAASLVRSHERLLEAAVEEILGQPLPADLDLAGRPHLAVFLEGKGLVALRRCLAGSHPKIKIMRFNPRPIINHPSDNPTKT